MKLTGLQIFKYLPGGKKEPAANCKKCGFPTCMAFAMKLAKGECASESCEYIPDELNVILEDSKQLQQAEITFGNSKNTVKVGNEIVMFRHDKKFVNATCLSISIKSNCSDFVEKVQSIAGYSVERVGEILKISAITLIDEDETFAGKAKIIAEHKIPLILVSSRIDEISKILDSVEDCTPLVNLITEEEDATEKLQKKYNVPIIISGSNPENIAKKTAVLMDKGIENLVISLSFPDKKYFIQNLTYLRRLSIEEKFKPLCFPVITFIKDFKEGISGIFQEAIYSAVLLCKYSNIVVFDSFEPAMIYALLTLRQNIFTDPEKPLQIEAKVYPTGETDENSPVIVTTNFALTYFTVAGEIESSNIPAYLVITPSDGMSVLTAWSADKFNGAIIAKAFKDFGVENLVKHRKMIIPGYVASLKSEIEEEMPDWEVIPGANEATDITDFLKHYITLS